MNKEELLAAVREHVNDDYWDDLEIPGYYVEEERKGGEGKGDHYHIVYKIFKGLEIYYVMATAYYSSYGGTEFSEGDVFFVEPFEKTVRDWKEVK